MSTVLVVDDRPINRQFLVTLLGYTGHRLLEAPDGAAALDLARAERPDLIITDIVMPRMDGVEFVHRLRALPGVGHTPVIFYTATYREREARALADSCGVAHVLVKPVAPQAILDTVHAALGARPPAGPAVPADGSGPAPAPQLTGESPPPGSDFPLDPIRVRALLTLSLDLAREREPLPMLERFCRAACEIAGARAAAVAVLGDDGERFAFFVAVAGADPAAVRVDVPTAEWGVLRRLLQARRAFRLGARGRDRWEQDVPAGPPPVRELVGVPVTLSGQRLGGFYLVDKLGGGAFLEEDERLAVTLGEQLAVAYEHVRLVDEIQRHAAALQLEMVERRKAAERIERLQAATAALSKALTPVQVAEVVVRQGLTATGAAAGMVLLLSEDETALEVLQSVGYPEAMIAGLRHLPLDVSASLTDSIRTRAPVWVASHSDYRSRYAHAVAVRAAHRLEASAAVPLEVDGEVRGVLGLCFPEPRAFGPEDREFIQTLARLCAQALKRSRLYEAERQAVRQRDQFISVASHELRTPITLLQGYTEGLARIVERALESEPEGSASVRVERARLVRGVEKLGQANARLTRLVDELLDVSRIQHQGLSLSPERVDLSAMLANVLEGVAQKQETGRYAAVHVRMNSSVEGPVWGEWDAGRLEQVLENLIDNALKYSPPTGEITVSLDVESGEGNPSQVQVHLVVRDQGIGIPPEETVSIFQVFTRATNASARNYPGLGLGLAICREIVERHGGRIWVESEGSGRGSAFHVILPGAEKNGQGGRRGE